MSEPIECSHGATAPNFACSVCEVASLHAQVEAARTAIQPYRDESGTWLDNIRWAVEEVTDLRTRLAAVEASEEYREVEHREALAKAEARAEAAEKSWEKALKVAVIDEMEADLKRERFAKERAQSENEDLWHQVKDLRAELEAAENELEEITKLAPIASQFHRYEGWSVALAVADVIDELRAKISESEHDMHMRIRAGYDKTVADAWRAKLEAAEREVGRANSSYQRDVLDLEKRLATSEACGAAYRELLILALSDNKSSGHIRYATEEKMRAALRDPAPEPELVGWGKRVVKDLSEFVDHETDCDLDRPGRPDRCNCHASVVTALLDTAPDYLKEKP